MRKNEVMQIILILLIIYSIFCTYNLLFRETCREALPDINIIQIETINSGELANITAFIHNGGEAKVLDNFHVGFYVDDILQDIVLTNFNTFAPGETIYVFIQVPLPRQSQHTTKVFADFYDLIPEITEENNNYSKSFFVN